MLLRRLFPLGILAILGFALSAFAQSPPGLVGRIEGTTYVSPTGAFKFPIPVLPELGGSIVDTDNVVTFQDDFSLHASIACFEMDATQRWELETRGAKDYLIWFFTNFVQADFARRFEGARVESAKYLRTVMDGSLVVYNLLPGGSMFAEKIALTGAEPPPTAKRGNLIFVKNRHVYVISTEFAEKVLQRSTYDKTTKDEDDALQTRLIEIGKKISFTALPTVK